MKRGLRAAYLLLLVAGAGSAQDTEVFAPFVSRLRATVADDAVILSWRPSQDVAGSYLVYRSLEEITEATFSKAEFLGRVGSDRESYTDYPPFGAQVFYAVLIESTDGRIYSIFIPFRNKTSSSVATTVPSSSATTVAEIRGITTQVQDQSVLITFTSTSPARDLFLFRSTRPIRRVEDLAESGAPIPLSGGTTMYQDRPIAGVEYYYGVVDAVLLRSGRAPIALGENSTRTAVIVPLGLVQPPSPTRQRPLPRLVIPAGVEFGDELIPSPPFALPRTQELGPAAARAVAVIRAQIRPAPETPMQPVTLEEDRTVARGEDSILAEIVRTSFTDKNYTDAQDRIQRFLRIQRTPRTASRANFYLGQIYYFQGDTRLAFLTFLLANDHYYEQTQPWLDTCLEELS